MPQRKLYLASIGAIRWKGSELEGEHTAKLTTSSSLDEVLLLLKETAFTNWPESEGWENHMYKATEFSESDLEFLQNFINSRYDDVENLPTEYLM